MSKTSLVLVLALFCACSPGDPTAGPAPRPRESATLAPTTFVNGGVCPVDFDDHPRRIGCVSEAGPVKVFARVDGEDMPKSWWIRLRNADQRLHAGNAFSYPRVVAQIDIDQDGNHEWLVKTYDLAGHGTNWQQLGLFVLNRWKRKLLQVTIPGGEPLAVRVGGISRMGEGARCDGDHLVILRTEAEDRQNVHWSFSERTYEITKGVAREVGLERGRLSLSDYNDPKLDPYYAVDCHGVAYP